MAANNPLTAPGGPSPWGARGSNVVPAGTPQIRGNALVRPAPPVPAAPLAPVSGQMQPGPQTAEAPPPAVEDPISSRVMVPKADFPEEHHKEIHEKTMGEEFDRKEAREWVQHVYPVVRRANPNIDPRHILEATRDAYYAVKHGFASNHAAGYMVGHHARRRHAEAEARKLDATPLRVVLPVT